MTIQVSMYYLSNGKLWNAVFQNVSEWYTAIASGMYADVTITEVTVVPEGGAYEHDYLLGLAVLEIPRGLPANEREKLAELRDAVSNYEFNIDY